MAFPFIEFLEPRVAPAALVGASTVSFQDVDGDQVTLQFSKDVLGSEAQMNQALTFTPGSNGGESLASLDLSKLNLPAIKLSHLDISITATQAGGGNGSVDVGAILASGIDLRRVFVDGALGKIIAGDNNVSTCGLQALKVGSLGLPDASEPADLSQITSIIVGSLGKMDVAGNLDKASLYVIGSERVCLGPTTIGGSLVGGDADQSGFIASDGRIAKISVGGSLTGGDGKRSGSIFAHGNIASICIGGDVTGGSGADGYSGNISAVGKIFSATVGGDLVGGTGERSGRIGSDVGVQSVHVNGDIIGGDGYAAGRIETGGKLGKVVVGGDIVGGTANYSGSVMSTKTVTSIHVGGSLDGAGTKGSGSIFSEQGITSLKVKGNLNGGGGEASGCVEAARTVHTAHVDGNLVGSTGSKSGSVVSYGGQFLAVDHQGTATHGTGANSGMFYEPERPSHGSGATSGCVVDILQPVGSTVAAVGVDKTGSASLTLSGGVLVSSHSSSGTLTHSGTRIILGNPHLGSGVTFSGATTEAGGTLVLNNPASQILPQSGNLIFPGNLNLHVAGTIHLNATFLNSLSDSGTLIVADGANVILPGGATLPVGTYTKAMLTPYFTVG